MWDLTIWLHDFDFSGKSWESSSLDPPTHKKLIAECRNSGTISKGFSKKITNFSGRRLKQAEEDTSRCYITKYNIFLYSSVGEVIGRQW